MTIIAVCYFINIHIYFLCVCRCSIKPFVMSNVNVKKIINIFFNPESVIIIILETSKISIQLY